MKVVITPSFQQGFNSAEMLRVNDILVDLKEERLVNETMSISEFKVLCFERGFKFLIDILSKIDSSIISSNLASIICFRRSIDIFFSTVSLNGFVLFVEFLVQSDQKMKKKYY